MSTSIPVDQDNSMKNEKELDVKEVEETTTNVETTLAASTAHPAIADGSVSSTNPLRKFMQRTKEKFDAVPQGWGQVRTNTGAQSGDSDKDAR